LDDSEEKHKLYNLGPFTAGINNISKRNKLPDNSVRKALNVDFHEDGSVRTRNKISKIYTGNVKHLYKRHFVEDRVLKYLNADNTATTVNDKIQSGTISYCHFNNRIYYTDNIYIYDDRHQVIAPSKPNIPLLDELEGSLERGSYQIVLTYKDKLTNFISGASSVARIENSLGGIKVHSFINKPTHNIEVYISKPNGTNLYYYKTLDNSTTSIDIKNIYDLQRPCPTINLDAMPGGTNIFGYKGRLFTVSDNVLWFSQIHNYGLNNKASDFIMFADKISIAIAVENGIYISSDQTYFLHGDDPSTAKLIKVSDSKGIYKTEINIDASAMDANETGSSAFWFSDKGGILGSSNGKITELSKNRVAVPDGLSVGTSSYREHEGIRQIVASLLPNADPRSDVFGASDKVTATLIRNGIPI